MSAPDPKSKRLLVIDDDDDLRDIFKFSMEKAGFVVAGAEDGVNGLAKVAPFQPHLIVLDLMMPNLNGFEVIHKLQQQDLGHIPVIVMTGYSDASNAQIAKEPNVVEFLQKPIVYDELAAMIRRLLDK